MLTVMSGTSVKETRVRHADMTKLPDESNKNTPTRQGRGMRRVQSMGSGTVSRSASVNALKQPSTIRRSIMLYIRWLGAVELEVSVQTGDTLDFASRWSR